MKLKYILFALFAIGLASCKEEASDNKLEEIQTEGQISSIIRNPISLNNQDTINVAKMTFEETEYHFGEVDEGAIVKHTFRFENTGKAPLLIGNARSTCGCTIPEWPEEPVLPGEKGEIYVEFNTANKKDFQSKPVTITANTFPSQTRILVKGRVNGKK